MEKGIQKYPQYNDSPFLNELVTTIQTRGKQTAISRQKIQVIDKDTGEINERDEIFMHIRKEIDKEKFIKIFTTELQLIFDLSRNASKTISYFMKALKINDDMVLFNLENAMNYLGYSSPRSIYTGLAELLDKRFIARTSTFNLYYINPKMIFNGDRMVIINEYVLKKSKKEMKDPEQIDMFANKTNAEIKQIQDKHYTQTFKAK